MTKIVQDTVNRGIYEIRCTPYIEGIPPSPLPATATPPSQILHLTMIGWLRSFVII